MFQKHIIKDPYYFITFSPLLFKHQKVCGPAYSLVNEGDVGI